MYGMYRTFEFGPRSARRDSNVVPQLKSSLELTVLIYILWSQGTLYRFDISHKLSSIANFAIKENPHDKRMLHSNSKRRERKERKNPEKGLVYFGFLPFTAPLLLAFHRKVNVSAKMFRFLNFP